MTRKKLELLEETIPESYLCSISHELMRKPVLLQCGHLFDESSIKLWFQKQALEGLSPSSPSSSCSSPTSLLSALVSPFLPTLPNSLLLSSYSFLLFSEKEFFAVLSVRRLFLLSLPSIQFLSHVSVSSLTFRNSWKNTRSWILGTQISWKSKKI
jgi:hypothetical protein